MSIFVYNHLKTYKYFIKNTIAALAHLYDIGYFKLYSEEYDKGLPNKLKKSKAELTRIYLLGNGIVKEKILDGLSITGQKSLLAFIGNKIKKGYT